MVSNIVSIVVDRSFYCCELFLF